MHKGTDAGGHTGTATGIGVVMGPGGMGAGASGAVAVGVGTVASGGVDPTVMGARGTASNPGDAGSAASGAPSRPRTMAQRLALLIPYLIIVVGMAVLAYPVANSWWEAWQASNAINEVTSTYDEMSDPERTLLRAEARHYNDVLATGGNLTALTPYEDQLSFQDSEMIAYIAIPKCSVRLPIYHGTEEKVLMVGVGHLRGTSLPAGGSSSHCVLTAHTGIPGKRMFDDIHLLNRGDEFVVWVLGEPLAYRVIGTEVVVPEDVSSIGIEEGRDLCTLVTCTPYGVNSHRLLVHAERCAYVPGEEEIPDLEVYVNNRTAPLLVAMGVLALFAVGLVVHRLRRRRSVGRSLDKRLPQV